MDDKKNSKEALKPYKKAFDYSYTLGAFPTIELLKAKPEQVREVYVHSTFTDTAVLQELCGKHRIPLRTNDKVIARLSDKENVFVIGVFEKYEETLDASKSQIVLVNPSNMGNMGTILRTAVGFGIYDIAFISPAVDVFNPKVVRSSMGALFRLRHQYFDSYEEYRAANKEQEVFTFMLNAKRQLTVEDCPKPKHFALVFGNEATGLPDSYLDAGTSIIIPQSPDVDSLNLTIAVGVGTFLFTRNM
ncbi:MAG: TrmH family RNA methyltransferase [Lachnospiraceae bacterium]|nr:TrmH family RNA methyltransferase [Lachnospiraceae bacterium]